jgi:hypothetical protein
LANLVIENNRNALVFLPSNSLKPFEPGENNILDSDWDSVKNHRAVKELLEEGVLTAKGKGKAKKLVEHIEKIKDPNKALKYIAHTDDVDLLKTWKKNDRRSQIKRAIDQRIKEVRDGGPDDPFADS